MRIYETTFVINPQTDDTTIDKHVKDVLNIISSSNGKVIHESAMGTRRLAYEINGLTQGYYASFLYEADSDVLPKLDRHFKVNEAYIRDLTVRIDVNPEDVIKQIDPFGKHGSKDDDDNNKRSSRHESSSDSSEKEEKKEEPKAEAPAEEAEKSEEPEKTEKPVEDSSDENDSAKESDDSSDENKEL